MSQTKFLLVSLFAIFILLLPYNNTLLAQEEPTDVLSLALDMFKFDQYLPALDMLEANVESNKDNFNYWLYIGLARQRTKQFNKALEAYETALKLNPDAKNLKVRISNLKKSLSNIDPAQIKDFKTNEEKSKWLFDEADSLRRDKKEEKAFRTFIQAVEYDVKLLGNDKNFVRRGVVFYRLLSERGGEYSKLFYAIFKYFEGEISEAFNLIKDFKKDDSKKPLAIQRLENYYFKKLADANNQQNEYEMAEREEKRKKVLEAQAKLAKKDKEDKEDKDSKNKISNKDIVSLENEVSEESFTYDIELDFIKDYASEMAKDKVKEYFAINNMTRKKKIISEIGYTGCSDEEVLEVIADGLQQDGMDFLATSVDALKTMNKPSNEKIVNILLNLLDAERPDHRYMGVQGLKYMSASPDKILPKLIDTFFSENNDYLRKQYAECASSYGKEALDYAYKLLEEKSRVDRRPVALFIHEMTGEKVDDLVNR